MTRIFIMLFVLLGALRAEDIYASFLVNAQKNASLAFDTSGIVKNVLVDVSSSVKKGDKLVELANDDIKASLEIAKAEAASAEIVYKYAQRDYERQSKVKDIIDEAKFDTFALAYERSKTALQQAKANVANKEALYNKTFLYAPFDGVIYEKNVEVGDVVNAMNLKTILKIQSMEDRKLILEFDQKYWHKVKVGQTFRYKIDGDSKEYNASISKVYPVANPDNRKLKAEVQAKGLITGLFGDGYIQVK